MGRIFKYLMLAFLAFFIFIWVSTLYKSLSKKKGNLSDRSKEKFEQKMEEMGINPGEEAKSIASSDIKKPDDYSKKAEIEEFTEKGGDVAREKVEFDDIDDEDVDTSNRIDTGEEDIEGDYDHGEDDEEEDDEEEMEADKEDENEGMGYDGEGRYMVIAGSFENPTNAKTEANRIKKMGFDKAEVVQFDRSDYWSVCVKRYFNEWEAGSLVKDLKENSVVAYVHKRRGKKVAE